jgi:protein O-mannosyl-transferase
MKNAQRLLGLSGALIVLLTVVTYIPALYGGFIWDDHNNITDNRLLRTWKGLETTWTDTQASIQYYPLSYTVFWFEYNLWGTDTFGYHLVNVLLHAANAVLMGLLFFRLGVPGAWLAAVLFAVHPVHVESVAWITELKNVLSGFFFLSALLAFLRFEQRAERRWWFYAFSLLLFVCALLSKTSTVALPVALVLVLWWKLERVKGRDLWPVLPFILVGAALSLLTVWLEKHHVGAEGSEWQLSLVERWLVAGRVVWFAVGKFVWPHPLIFIYPRWQVDAGVWWQFLFPLAAVCVLLSLWYLRRRVGKGPLAAALFFVGTTAPVPAAFNLYFMRFSYVADHFYYLAGIGFMVLVAAALTRAVPNSKFLIAVALPMAAILSALSWQRCHAFRDEETLWRDTVAQNPNAWMAHNNLGIALEESGRFQDAIRHYEQALRLEPDYAKAYNNLGGALVQLGRVQEAIGHYEQALRIMPDSAEVHCNLGIALEQSGRVREAIGHFEQALRIMPDYAEAHYNLGVALEQGGRIQEATRHFDQVLRIKPDYAEAHYNLGVALQQTGRLQEAMEHWEHALRLKPDYAEAHYSLGSASVRLGRVQEAIDHWQQALRIRPDYAEAHYDLGVALVGLGKVQEAIGHWEQALRLKPDCAEAHYNLGVALERAGRLEDATRHFEQALRINPYYAEARNRLARLRAVQ